MNESLIKDYEGFVASAEKNIQYWQGIVSMCIDKLKTTVAEKKIVDLLEQYCRAKSEISLNETQVCECEARLQELRKENHE